MASPIPSSQQSGQEGRRTFHPFPFVFFLANHTCRWRQQYPLASYCGECASFPVCFWRWRSTAMTAATATTAHARLSSSSSSSQHAGHSRTIFHYLWLIDFFLAICTLGWMRQHPLSSWPLACWRQYSRLSLLTLLSWESCLCFADDLDRREEELTEESEEWCCLLGVDTSSFVLPLSLS